MLRLHLILSILLLAACESQGTWPGGGGGDPPDGGGGGGGGGDNILRNGGFEQLDSAGTFAQAWANIDDNPDGMISLVESPVYAGERALQFQIDAAGDGWEYFVIQSGIDPALLVAGARYELSGRYRINRVGSDISFNYIVRGEGDDPNIGNDWDDTHPSEADTWEPFAWQFTIPEGSSPSNYDLYLHLIKWTGFEVRLEVDAVALRRM